MSRFSGPAGRGASRTLRILRRVEAETRQAAERARDEAWRARYLKPEPLTNAELDSLIDAMLRLGAWEAWDTATRGAKW